MNEIKIFENDQFGQVRTILTEANEILFAGVDIANALGYANPSKAVVDHVNQDYKNHITNSGRWF